MLRWHSLRSLSSLSLVLIIGVVFIPDYPEQVGAYRDNDANMTPEVAKAMMEEEIEKKRQLYGN